ncbi:GNAT family N-acetyltransferase [Alkaliphilus transvaalensis]|uniref:GNAT family N-acetyltransferase n=1 Tax=Alkaliphilus transvaalensis TaxID=114628 RepID=UPI00047E1630|nr:GNAT family N-acetyltransferase [Alkaliphilus transvaalensis]
MIKELKKEQFFLIKPLLKGEFVNLEIKGVAAGNNPGWVFVDDIEEPKTAMIWSKGIQGFYFVGDENNQNFNHNIIDYIHTEIAPRAKKLGLEWFEFSGTSEIWDKTFERIFKDIEINKSKQFVYTNTDLNILPLDSCQLKEGYTLREVKKDLLKNKIYNLDFVESAIKEWWDSVDDFIKHGVGYYILYKDVAVCSCVTSFVADHQMELHIKTAEEHRKKGLATVAVKEFVKHCKKKQYILYWDCMEENIGSRVLAEKCGYSKAFEYFLYYFKFD